MLFLLHTLIVYIFIFQNFVPDQAAFSLISRQKFVLNIANCLFEYNNRAVNVYLTGGVTSNVFIDLTEFNGNIAGGPGGAVFIDQLSGEITSNLWYNLFTNNFAVELKNTLNNSTTIDVELSKITGSGGAIAVHIAPYDATHVLSIHSCTFDNNTADTYGGSISISPTVVSYFYENIFKNLNERSAMRPRVGDLLESRGAMTIVDCIFQVITASSTVPVISYRSTELGSYLESDNVTFLCPIGFSTEKVVSYISLGEGRQSIEALLLYCVPCIEALYSLSASELVITNFVFSPISNSTCLECPYGALCDVDIKAKANFWGNQHGDEIYMYLCPEGYCCQDLTCYTFDVCASKRSGTLCGECLEGYSEALFSAECILDEECTYASLFWLVIILYGLLYVIFFILEEEWQVLLSNFTVWIKAALFRALSKFFNHDCLRPPALSNVDRISDGTQDEEEDDTAGAYMSIFMYYIQIPSILKIAILYRDDDEMPLEELLNTIKNIFSFNTFGLHLKTCLFKGVTAVFKVWIKSAFVIYLFVILLLVYVVVRPISALFRREKTWSIFNKSAPLNAKFVSALVSLLLYTYQYFAENGLAMLKCVDIASEDPSPVLFIDAHVTCYQTWQYFVIAFVGIYVIPFAFVLALGPDLLKRKIITTTIFIVSLFLPLFSTPYLFYKFINERRHDTNDNTSTRGNYQGVFKSIEPKDKTSGDLVSRLLADPYRNTFAWGICWEGIIAVATIGSHFNCYICSIRIVQTHLACPHILSSSYVTTYCKAILETFL